MLGEVSGLTFLVLGLLLALSAFFSAAEAAILSAQRVRLRHLVATGSAAARLVEETVQQPARFLTTVLLGNNLANTAFAALVTVLLQAYVGPQGAVALSTVLATALLLLFGELAPKTIAVSHAERLALLFVYPMRLFTLLFAPIAAPVSGLAARLGLPHLRLGGVEEIRAMVATGVHEGTIEQQEAELVEKVFRFGDRQVREVLTPRTEIVWVRAGTTLAELLALYLRAPHTRFPVYWGTMENVVGVLSVKDVLRARAQGRLNDRSVVTDLLRPAVFVPESKPVGVLFREMRASRSPLALAVDEHGSIAGLVTLKQLVEEIVGPLSDELNRLQPAVAPDLNTYHVAGTMSIDEANAGMALRLPPGDYQTVAGFLLSRMGHIPQEGEEVQYNGLDLVVERMQGPKIERLLIRRRA